MTAPDPGLTDLIAAHQAGDRWTDFQYPSIFSDEPCVATTTKMVNCSCGEAIPADDHPAHVALVVEQHTNGRIAELDWDALVAAIPDGWELRESAQLEEVSRVRQRDLEASQAATARWRARAEKAEKTVTELEAQLEKYRAEEHEDLEWERFCAQQDVRCTVCNLRYGEREQYGCGDPPRAHRYDENELREALEGDQQ